MSQKGQLLPYTMETIQGKECAVARCHAPAEAQWRTCAGDRWLPVCRPHDLDLNRLLLDFFGFRSAKQIVQRYAEARGVKP